MGLSGRDAGAWTGREVRNPARGHRLHEQKQSRAKGPTHDSSRQGPPLAQLSPQEVSRLIVAHS